MGTVLPFVSVEVFFIYFQVLSSNELCIVDHRPQRAPARTSTAVPHVNLPPSTCRYVQY